MKYLPPRHKTFIMSKLILFCLILSANYGKSWRIFHRGRHVGGNLGQPRGIAPKEVIPDQWFDQILDHFDTSDYTTWSQRYFINDQFYNGSNVGPVFLMISGEGEASTEWMTQGSWIDYAQIFGALCFQLEHRYYGQSHPTINLSTKNLQYLSSQQALADLATFIEGMNLQYNMSSDVKWIVFGGSYSGALAAWMRLKYPHLVHGAMSASGPLLAKLDFYDYFRVVEESLRTHSDACVNAIRKGYSQIETLMRQTVGRRQLNDQFRLCNPLDITNVTENDISNFYDIISGYFAMVVQYNKDNRFGIVDDNITIDTLCDIMTNQDLGLEIDRLANINSMILSFSYQKCLDYRYQIMIDFIRMAGWDSTISEGSRQWIYQTCTELGFDQSSSYKTLIFGNAFPVEYFIQECVDIFGPKYNEIFQRHAVNRTNTAYGQLDIEVSNVIFVHGSIDPWHPLGITKTKSQNAPAIYIIGTAHCANMYPKSENDLPQLIAAREEIADYISTWIRL